MLADTLQMTFKKGGWGVKFPSLLVLNVKDIGMKTPIITNVIFIIRRERNILYVNYGEKPVKYKPGMYHAMNLC